MLASPHIDTKIQLAPSLGLLLVLAAASCADESSDPSQGGSSTPPASQTGSGGSHGSGGSTAAATLDDGGCAEAQAMRDYNLQWVNNARAQTGLSPYVLDDCLSGLAQRAVQDVADGGDVHGMFVRECIRNRPNCECNWQQENYGAGGGSTTDWTLFFDMPLSSMMQEPKGTGHRANIESTDYTRLGVGVVCDGASSVQFVNTFGP
ncbi:MAG: CAP domain-containing protein [Polyangiales bacterium]